MTEQTGNNKPNEAEKAHTTTPPDGWFYMGSHVGAPWLNLEFSEEMDETGLPLWERPVQHTPTDDERGDLIGAASAAFKARGGAPDWEEDAIARDLIIRWHLRGFEDGERFGRRAVVPEPSAEDAMSHYTDPADPFWQSHPEPQGEPSDAQVLVEAIEKAISKLHWFPNNGVAEDLRAALRAAGEVDR